VFPAAYEPSDATGTMRYAKRDRTVADEAGHET
jgi:hypothetical protein